MSLIRLPSLFDSHRRWVSLLDRDLDGDLSPEERDELSTHEAGCLRCSLDRRSTLSIRHALRSNLPEAPAPRSFALTHAMLREAPGESPEPAAWPRRAALAMQGTAAAAVILLGGLLVADFAPTDSSDDDSGIPLAAEGDEFDTGTTGLATTIPENAGGSIETDDGDAREDGDGSNPGDLPPSADATGGDGSAGDSGDAADSDNGADGESAADRSEGALPPEGQALNPADGAITESLAAQTEPGDGGPGALRIAQFATAALAVVAIAGFVALRRTRSEL